MPKSHFHPDAPLAAVPPDLTSTQNRDRLSLLITTDRGSLVWLLTLRTCEGSVQTWSVGVRTHQDEKSNDGRVWELSMCDHEGYGNNFYDHGTILGSMLLRDFLPPYRDDTLNWIDTAATQSFVELEEHNHHESTGIEFFDHNWIKGVLDKLEAMRAIAVNVYSDELHLHAEKMVHKVLADKRDGYDGECMVYIGDDDVVVKNFEVDF
ncbi:hypothetical protein CPC08DRAFT_764503 [Agrocybe pediades]|nr:hypothetical protein CPC08DRAFT_764503 [Agrocybe pediades]